MTHRTFDYAILVALDEEARYFSNVVACGLPDAIEDGTYWPITDCAWEPFGHGVLVSAGQMGRTPAQQIASATVETLGTRLLVNIGIAGRIDESLHIGDVVVPEFCLDVTERSKITGTDATAVYVHSPRTLNVPGNLVPLIRLHLKTGSTALALINARLRRRFSGMTLLSDREIRVVSQPVCCVPNVGANDHYRRSLRALHRNLAAMDMESIGVIEAAEHFGVPLICARGVSDDAGFNKTVQESVYKDENRRLATEAAVAVVEQALALHRGKNSLGVPKGLTIAADTDGPSGNLAASYEANESLFSLLVRSGSGDLVDHPIREMARMMRKLPHDKPVVLFGEKGAGKTSLFRHLQRILTLPLDGQSTGTAGRSIAILLRLSELENWHTLEIDKEGTRLQLKLALERIVEIASGSVGPVYLLVDGLNRTGGVRVQLVKEILSEIGRFPAVKLAISAESTLDVQSLYRAGGLLDPECRFKLEPMDIEDEKVGELVARFGTANDSPDAHSVLRHMKSKDVRSVDIFMLAAFYRTFTSVVYKDSQTLSQDYDTLCEASLRSDKNRSPEERRRLISDVAEIVFDILISKTKSVAAVKSLAVVDLISRHSSITNYLVARHVVDVILGARGKGKKHSKLDRRLSYVLPAEVNSFTKQMMRADWNIEAAVIEVIKEHHHKLSTLARCHIAYLAGRVSPNNAAAMRQFLQDFDYTCPAGQAVISHEQRMLRRTVFVSRALLGDHSAELEYVHLLLTDVDEAGFNRGFHLVYWGDVPFEPHGRMDYRDSGEEACNRTFARLRDRIRERLPQVPLIELLTLLSVVQVRHANRTLRKRHRQATLDLLRSEQLRERYSFPEMVRGYLARIEEDLGTDKFNIATVLQEWNDLDTIERTGWLKRRSQATSRTLEFWAGRRLESVSEHTLSAVALAETFLHTRPTGEESYNKEKVISMLRIHDLAEARVGDLIQGMNHKLELEVLYKYAAFATYRGVGDLWTIPERFKEFAVGQTLEAKIAQDLDRLQFILKARCFRAGMSPGDAEACEKSRSKLMTSTVRDIDALLRHYPAEPRYVLVEPDY
jgi:nucleoside phosphorylase/5'-deoxynucleotidase YfbR-like HD superfamily hydrolase